MMRKLSLILCACLLASSVLSACSASDDTKSPAVTTASDDPAATTAADEGPSDLELRDAIEDGLPDVNFDNRDFRIYVAKEDYAKTFYMETADGDVVNDAVAKSIDTTEERFGVKISTVYSSGDGNADINHNNAILKLIKSSDNTVFEIAENHDSLSGSASVDGNYVNLKNIDHLDFTKPWWASNAMESLEYMDQIYLASSAMSYRGFNNTRVIYFNKDLLKNYSIAEPYADVFAGTWTLNKLIDTTKDIYEDLDADGERSTGDRFGYIASYPIYCYLESYGIPTVNKDEDSLTVAINTDRTVTMVEKLYNFYYETKGGIIYDKGLDGNPSTAGTLFSNNQSLFVFGELNDAMNMFRHSNVSYGIIPTPKLDDIQEDYLAAYTDRFFVIPTTTDPDDYDFIGIIMEAMSAEGYKKIYPAYYEVALKTKFTSDNESMQTLDLINECRILDFAFVYCSGINGVINNLLNPTNNPSSNFVSAYNAQEKQLNATLKNVYKKFEKMSENY